MNQATTSVPKSDLFLSISNSAMAVSMKSSGVLFSGSSATKLIDLTHRIAIPSTFNSIQFAKSQSLETVSRPKSTTNFSINANYCLSREMKRWEKTMKPNMVEIRSAQDLVNNLKNAGNQLVVIDFYSPGCGGCRALHPKICELAESNPDAIFLKVNYEELKEMCYALHIHVLPFFRFYRGSKGRVCSFSCTISTISKFKEALAKYSSTEVQSGVGGRAKGLDESELRRLTSIEEISAGPEKGLGSEEMENLFMEIIKNPNPPSVTEELLETMENNSFLVSNNVDVGSYGGAVDAR